MQEMYPSLVFINPNVKLHFSTMNVLKKVMTWISISFSLWLILITPAVTAWGPVPPSAPSSCTHIGVGNGDHRRCPPALVGGSSSKEATLVGGSTVYSNSNNGSGACHTICSFLLHSYRRWQWRQPSALSPFHSSTTAMTTAGTKGFLEERN